MTIQRAQSSDLDTIQGLLRSCDLPHEDLTPAHLEHFFVNRDGDTLCGVVGTEPYDEVALLRSLAVSPDFRSEGLGARLIEAIERQAHRRGIRTFYLLTTTAAAYFQRHGYERIERDALPDPIQKTDEAARLCPASAVCMRKELRATEKQA